MGPAGMHSFGHAAYFGLGAYGAALLVRSLGLPMELTLVLSPFVAALARAAGSAVRCGRLLAMLTLRRRSSGRSCSQWADVTAQQRPEHERELHRQAERAHQQRRT